MYRMGQCVKPARYSDPPIPAKRHERRYTFCPLHGFSHIGGCGRHCSTGFMPATGGRPAADEDTDRKRSTAEAIDAILTGLMASSVHEDPLTSFPDATGIWRWLRNSWPRPNIAASAARRTCINEGKSQGREEIGTL